MGETDSGVTVGECRAYPPRPLALTSQEHEHPDDPTQGQARLAVWPITEEEEWCASFHPKDFAKYVTEAAMMGPGGSKVN